MGRAARKLKSVPQAVLKLDLGCGPHKREGFTGVDRHPFLGVDLTCDLSQPEWVFAGQKPDSAKWCDETEPELGWLLPDNAVLEAHSSHFVEHLTAMQRVAFCNALYRVLVPGGTCQIVTPHWSSCRAYGDPTHQWPPVSEFWFYYLSQPWRLENAPHTDRSVIPDGFACNFEATWGYTLRPDVTIRNQEFQQFAVQNYKDVVQDVITTLKALK